MLKINEVDHLLVGYGFRVVHETKKKKALQSGSGLFVYLNLNSKTGRSALIFHPDSGVEPLRDRLPGVLIGRSFYHSSNMTEFPLRKHKGVKPIPYGWPVSFTSAEGLRSVIDHLSTKATTTSQARAK